MCLLLCSNCFLSFLVLIRPRHRNGEFKGSERYIPRLFSKRKTATTKILQIISILVCAVRPTRALLVHKDTTNPTMLRLSSQPNQMGPLNHVPFPLFSVPHPLLSYTSGVWFSSHNPCHLMLVFNWDHLLELPPQWVPSVLSSYLARVLHIINRFRYKYIGHGWLPPLLSFYLLSWHLCSDPSSVCLACFLKPTSQMGYFVMRPLQIFYLSLAGSLLEAVSFISPHSILVNWNLLASCKGIRLQVLRYSFYLYPAEYVSFPNNLVWRFSPEKHQLSFL